MRLLRTFSLHLAAFILLALGGCVDDSGSALLLDPARVEIVAGDGQAGPPGAELLQPLVVRVLGEDGAPLSGIEVTWAPLDGSVAPELNRTDADGRASTVWTLGETLGEQTVVVAPSRTPQHSVRFTATAEEAGR